MILPDGIVEIGDQAFLRCKNLKSIDLGDKLQKLGKQSFMSSGLEEITLPKTLKSVDSQVLYCENLKKVTVTRNTLEKNSVSEDQASFKDFFGFPYGVTPEIVITD